MNDAKPTIKKLTIKDSNGCLETFHDVRLINEQFMGKDWYTVILENSNLIRYNPDKIIFLIEAKK